MSSESNSKYWAFISYSHADRAAADWLHKALETYRIPRHLVGKEYSGIVVPKRLYPIFRDCDELASSESLASKVEEALMCSHALIVIASPSSARSRWVNEEIRRFKARGRNKPVLCIIIDGEPHASAQGDAAAECFAPALRFEVDQSGELTNTPTEPLAADIRRGKESKRNALLKLIAGVLDVGLDSLKQRDLQRRNRQMIAVSVTSLAAAAFTSILAAFALQQRDRAEAQQVIAETRREQAEGLIEFMLGDLRQKLEPIGKLDVLDALGDEAMKYFSKDDTLKLSDKELSVRGKALRQLGEIRVNQGHLDAASPMFLEALRLDEEQTRRNPQDAQIAFNVAQSEFYIGYDLFLRGQYADAQPWFQRYMDSAERLLELEPENDKWKLEKHYALDGMATNHLRLGNWPECIRLAKMADAGARSIVAGGDVDAETILLQRTNSMNKVGLCARNSGNERANIRTQREIEEIQGALLQAAPDNYQYSFQLAVTKSILGSSLLEIGRLTEAEQAINESTEIFDLLLSRDPSNAQWRSFQLTLLGLHIDLEVLRGNTQQAMSRLRIAEDAYNNLTGASYNAKGEFNDMIRLRSLSLVIHGRTSGLEKQRKAADLLEDGLKRHDANENFLPASMATGCAVLTRWKIQHSYSVPEFCIRINQLPIRYPSTHEALVAQALRDMNAGRVEQAQQLARKLKERGLSNAIWQLYEQ